MDQLNAYVDQINPYPIHYTSNNGTINANDTSGREKRAYLDNADRARIINVAEEEEDPMGSTQRTG